MKMNGEKKSSSKKIPFNRTRHGRLKKLLEQIKRHYGHCVERKTELTRFAILTGCDLLTLEEVRRKKKKKVKVNFREYLINKLKIPPETAYRYMRLAKCIDIKKTPHLALIGITKLERLRRLSGKESIDDFLTSNNVGAPSEDYSEDQFKQDVGQLILNSKHEKSGRHNKAADSKSTTRNSKNAATQLNRSISQCISDVEPVLKKKQAIKKIDAKKVTSLGKKLWKLRKMIETLDE